MQGVKLTDDEIAGYVGMIRKHGNVSAAARMEGIPRSRLKDALASARVADPNCLPRAPIGNARPWARDPASQRAAAEAMTFDDLRAALRQPRTTDGLADHLGIRGIDAKRLIERARAHGIAITQRADKWHMVAAPSLGSARDAVRELVTDRHGRLRFGAIGDTHLGSKYERLDCLEDWYSHAASRDVRTVLHAGNWIDGEASFNQHDLAVHGLDAQMAYLAKHHPSRPGLETWAIAGADHEGWYSRREGVDVGRYAERVMREAGRSDWHDMGYMETFVRLRHAVSGKSSMLCLMHPGGGSAYAISYAPQKIVEGFDGGDKPAVLLIGHYHKASYQLTRNVHTIQVGCFQDQTVFMRQKKLSSHLGGMIVDVEIDPRTGAVIECGTQFRNYFVKEYYTGRWSQHGPVKHATRRAA